MDPVETSKVAGGPGWDYLVEKLFLVLGAMFAIGHGVIGWFVSGLYSRLTTAEKETAKVRAELVDFKLQASQDFVRSSEFREFRQEFTDTMRRLFDKLDNKEDKRTDHRRQQ